MIMRMAKEAADSMAERAAVLGGHALAWVGNAVERRLHEDRFVVADQTPFEIIHEDGLLSVRRYPALEEEEIAFGAGTLNVSRDTHRVPILLVPPLAADPLNFDLLPERSLVRYLLARGFRVYLADFGSPDASNSDLNLSAYTTHMLKTAVEQVRANSGESELSLVGYCMGGLFALVYAAWSHDAGIRNIVTIASPIDIYQMGMAGRMLGAMQGPVRLIRRYTAIRIHALDPARMRIPGWMASQMFKLTSPMGVVRGYVDLLMNMWDREYVIHYQTMSKWFNRMHDYPGGIVQDFVVRVGLDNQFASGRIALGEDEEALLERIECSMLAIAGDNDKIVTVDAARKVLDIVKSADKRFRVAPGGHAGVFAGSRAAATTWTWTADWLAQRSDGAVRRAKPRRQSKPQTKPKPKPRTRAARGLAAKK